LRFSTSSQDGGSRLGTVAQYSGGQTVVKGEHNLADHFSQLLT
jgi:hypothetical protein